MCCLDVLCENAFEFFDLWPHDELAVTEDFLDRRVDPWLELLVLSFQIDELHNIHLPSEEQLSDATPALCDRIETREATISNETPTGSRAVSESGLKLRPRR